MPITPRCHPSPSITLKRESLRPGSSSRRCSICSSAAVSAATIRLIRGYVRSVSLGALAVGEGEPPLAIEQLLEVSPDYQLEHYFAHSRLSPLVGRDAELKVLADLMEPAAAGVIGGALTIIASYLHGRRRGRRRATVLEIRRS